jgi:hypothetical protein
VPVPVYAQKCARKIWEEAVGVELSRLGNVPELNQLLILSFPTSLDVSASGNLLTANSHPTNLYPWLCGPHSMWKSLGLLWMFLLEAVHCRSDRPQESTSSVLMCYQKAVEEAAWADPEPSLISVKEIKLEHGAYLEGPHFLLQCSHFLLPLNLPRYLSAHSKQPPDIVTHLHICELKIKRPPHGLLLPLHF